MEPTFNRVKAKRAAADPARPGEHSYAEPATYRPRVDRLRCEGRGDCVEVCPEEVFEVRRMDDVDFERLPFFARLHSRAHGRRTAYTPNADACLACGMCVVACPEQALTLERVMGS